jgi:hypothetical protein
VADEPEKPSVPINQDANRPVEEPVLFVPMPKGIVDPNSSALAALGASAAAGRAAYDKVESAKRRASGISRAPSPPPSLPNAHYHPDPPRDDLRRDILHAVEDSERIARKPTEKPVAPSSSRKTFSMSRDDSIFWISIAAFGGGFSVMSLSTLLGTILVATGIAGLIWANRGHMPKPPWRMAALIAAMVFTCSVVAFDIYDRNFGHRIPQATGRVWEPLAEDQKRDLRLILGALPKRDSIQIICLNTDCRALAESLMGIFYDVGWSPVLGTSNFFSEPYGIAIYQTDLKDQQLKAAIERTTKLKISNVLQSNMNLDSVFIGVRP